MTSPHQLIPATINEYAVNVVQNNTTVLDYDN